MHLKVLYSAVAASRPPSPAAIVSGPLVDDDYRQPLVERCTHVHMHMHTYIHA